MVSIESFKKIAQAFPNASQEPHFHLISFRINKKIFATLDVKLNRACLMLNIADQDVFCRYDKTIIYPVPNKWGTKGATFMELKKVPKDLLKDAITQAYKGKLKK